MQFYPRRSLGSTAQPAQTAESRARKKITVEHACQYRFIFPRESCHHCSFTSLGAAQSSPIPLMPASGNGRPAVFLGVRDLNDWIRTSGCLGPYSTRKLPRDHRHVRGCRLIESRSPKPNRLARILLMLSHKHPARRKSVGPLGVSASADLSRSSWPLITSSRFRSALQTSLGLHLARIFGFGS